MERAYEELVRAAMVATTLGVPGGADALQALRTKDFDRLREASRHAIPDVLRSLPRRFPTHGILTTQPDKNYCYLSIQDDGNYFKFVRDVMSLTEVDPRYEGNLLVDPYETSVLTHVTIGCGVARSRQGARVDFTIRDLSVHKHHLDGVCGEDWHRYVCPISYYALGVDLKNVRAPNAHISLALLGTPWPPE